MQRAEILRQAIHFLIDIRFRQMMNTNSFEALAGELRDRLDVRLPDGRVALLRFYDARVMPDMAKLFELTQRVQFFSSTYDWLVETNGQLTGVHPHA